MDPKFQQVAVVATAKKYYGLTHEPGGLTLDENGQGIWPNDQFTFRLVRDGAIELVSDEQLQARETAESDSAELKAHVAAIAEVTPDVEARKAKKG